jgi:hypothetical protein
MTWLVIAAVIIVVFLTVNLVRRLASDRLQKFIDRRRATSLFVSRGELVDGNRHLSVAIALSESTFFYENSDMEASIDLQWVEEIEYDTELATGTAVAEGRVLRLRCHSQTFEFILPQDVVSRWHLMLPPHRMRAAAAPELTIAQPATAG